MNIPYRVSRQRMACARLAAAIERPGLSSGASRCLADAKALFRLRGQGWVHGTTSRPGNARRNVSRPRLSSLRLILGSSPWYRRNVNEHLAGGTLNLSTGIRLVALKSLLAVGTFEFEFGHTFWLVKVELYLKKTCSAIVRRYFDFLIALRSRPGRQQTHSAPAQAPTFLSKLDGYAQPSNWVFLMRPPHVPE